MKNETIKIYIKMEMVFLGLLLILIIIQSCSKQMRYKKITSENLGNYLEVKDQISMKKKESCIAQLSLNEMDILTNLKGNEIISIKDHKFIKQDLPSKYYDDIDFSTFQPFMDYRKVVDERSPAYRITRSDRAYNDVYGFRRYRTNANDFTINGEDDYVVALGTFYKEKGTCGSRYLVITTTGMFTILTGDEKADEDTDKMNMFSTHGDFTSIIEWIVDQENLQRDIKFHGTVTAGPVKAIQGEIKYLYKIESSFK